MSTNAKCPECGRWRKGVDCPTTLSPACECSFAAPAGSAAGEVLADGTQILHDQSTSTTRWVLYRHHQTNKLNLAIVQGREEVSVSINNLRHMLEVIVPQHEPPNDKSSDPTQ